MLRRRTGWLVAVASVGAAACTSIAGLGGDFGEPDGGTASGAKEAGTTSSSGESTTSSSSGSSSSSSTSSSSGSTTSGGPDAAADAPPADADVDAGQDSGSSDSGADADAGTTPTNITPPMTNGTFCTAAVEPANTLFCYDFGGDPGPGASFNNGLTGSSRTSSAITGADGNALDTLLKSPPAGATETAEWDKTFTTSNGDHVASFTLTFYFRIATANNPYAVIGALQMNQDYGLAVSSTTCGTGKKPCIVQNAPGNTSVPANAPSVAIDGLWHLGTVKVVWNGASSAWDGTVSVDNRVLDSRAGAFNANKATSTGGSYSVLLGAFYSGGSGDVESYIDDALVVYAKQ